MFDNWQGLWLSCIVTTQRKRQQVKDAIGVSNVEKNKPNGTGLDRILRATYCSGLGLQAAWRHEQAFRQELLFCAILVPLGLWLGNSGVERAMLLGCLLLVLIVELLNSALEAVVDRIGTEYHELSGRAKDLGSASVSLSLATVVVTWLLVLL